MKTMANDNQTALMQSLTRRKTELKKHKERYAKLGHNKNSITGHCLNATIEAYELQITEDEKLLAADESTIANAWHNGMMQGEFGIPKYNNGGHYYRSKYGTDGK